MQKASTSLTFLDRLPAVASLPVLSPGAGVPFLDDLHVVAVGFRRLLLPPSLLLLPGWGGGEKGGFRHKDVQREVKLL